jgi:hypothetical protein
MEVYPASQDNSETAFSEYSVKYNKHYSTKEEFALRLSVFKKRLAEIRELNQMDAGATFGVNQFSDWTEEEYKQLLGAKGVDPTEEVEEESYILLDESAVPNGGIDWRS